MNVNGKVQRNKKQLFLKNISGWLLMLPTVILFVFFIWEPLIESIRLSLYRANGMRLVEFVGFKNYLDIFGHPDFLPALQNTFSYTIWSLIIGFLAPIVLAILVNEVRHTKSLFKISIYLPNVVPGMAMVLMWRYMFRTDNTGILNILLNGLGIGPQPWLSNPAWTIPLIVITLTWRGAGATTLLYIAGLQGIDPELYEAAIIDGAGIAKRIRYITLPSIFNLARTLLILQIIAVFQILYEPLVMTNGGPNNASLSIMQLVFRFAFERFDYPKATSVSVIICFILAILTILYFRISKRQDS
ncbi:MAG: sugar ABC transporter permease [Treponema sp.]|jgi:multiple sugar transport system permease protein|nr:sugar ABC transporter permease [Treponema sp.]